jgi:hypothetical protein
MSKNVYKIMILLCTVTLQSLGQVRDYTTKMQLKHPFRGIIELIGGAGVTYYQGDLREEPFKNLALGPNIAVGLTYRFAERFSARTELRLYNVGGSQIGAKKTQNNLSFRTTNPEIYLGIQADAFKFTDHKQLGWYGLAGVGFTRLNPQAKLDDKWYNLADYKTEGVAYQRNVLIAVGGIGATYRYNHTLNFGIEVTGTYVDSDYLDDVSTVYQGFANPADISARLADRKIDLGLAPNSPGFIRGNPKNKDVYYILSLRATHIIGSSRRAIAKKRTKCP